MTLMKSSKLSTLSTKKRKMKQTAITPKTHRSKRKHPLLWIFHTGTLYSLKRRRKSANKRKFGFLKKQIRLRCPTSQTCHGHRHHRIQLNSPNPVHQRRKRSLRCLFPTHRSSSISLPTWMNPGSLSPPVSPGKSSQTSSSATTLTQKHSGLAVLPCRADNVSSG